MSMNFNRFNIYIIEEDYFKFTYLKDKIIKINQNIHALFLKPNELRNKIAQDLITDVNDLFLFSIDLISIDSIIKLARHLRNSCQRCQIAFFGIDLSKIDLIKVNGLSVLGGVEITQDEGTEQLALLLSEAFKIQTAFLMLKETIIFESKKEKFVLDCQMINYIETVRNERKRVKVFFKNKCEYLTVSMKNIKESRLPEYFLCFKSLVINSNEICAINRTKNIIYFNNQEQLAVGYKLRKSLDEQMRQLTK